MTRCDGSTRPESGMRKAQFLDTLIRVVLEWSLDFSFP